MPKLSTHALANIAPNDIWAIFNAAFANQWSESNTDGIAMMGIAENRLMHPEILAYLNANLTVTPKMLTYGDGSTGSRELRTAVADYMNLNFAPVEPVTREHVTIGGGVTAIIDALSFCIAEPGDGILVAQPVYVGYVNDFEDRASVNTVYVPIGNLDNLTTMAGVACHEKALLESEKKGVKVKALVLCNPHNPLGRSYPPDVMEAYLALCSEYDIHLISDEVYAKTVFPSKDIPEPVKFTSVLSLDIKKFIDPSLVHVLYGISKDFCCNGLRIGAFVSTHNPKLQEAMGAVAKFQYPSSLSDQAWRLMLTDQEYLKSYFTELTKRMTVTYELCTDILKAWEIPYIPASCGPFVWVDLTRFLPNSTVEDERLLAWKMIKSGVWLATGEAFRSEAPGWFRLTFTLPEKQLRIGMERLREVLAIEL